MSSRIWSVVLVIGASHVVAAQESLMIPSDREASAQVASILASAREAGLPTNPIVGKVNYGVNAMRSKPDAIVRAASLIKTRLETAKGALGPKSTEPEIVEGAGALAESATVETLRSVRRAGGNRSVASALGLLTQLLATNVALPRATEVVTELLRQGATPGQLVALGNDISSDTRNGAQVLASMDVRTHNLIATLAAPGGIAAAVEANSLTTSGDIRTGATAPPQPPRRP